MSKLGSECRRGVHLSDGGHARDASIQRERSQTLGYGAWMTTRSRAAQAMPLEWPTSILTGGVFQVGQLPGTRFSRVSWVLVNQCPAPQVDGRCIVEIPDDKGRGHRQVQHQGRDEGPGLGGGEGQEQGEVRLRASGARVRLGTCRSQNWVRSVSGFHHLAGPT